MVFRSERGRQLVEVEFVSNAYEVDHKQLIPCNIRDITGRRQLDRDSSGEDLINLLVGAEIATEEEIALLLGMNLDEFRYLRLNRLPLDNGTIGKELGVTLERVYKLRFRAGKRLKSLLDEINSKKKRPM
jgi:hypothetical protein